MKIYPEANVSFYVDKPSCLYSYLKHGPSHSWKPTDKPFRPKEMPYWIDTEGRKMIEIKTKDLYFKDWPKSRIRKEACLGLLYSTGYRFIKLTQAPPAGYKCAPLPINLQMAQMVNIWLAQKEKAEKKAQKKIADEEKAKKKAEVAYKNRTKKKGRR